MTDVAALGLSIDSNGVVKASADLDKFAASSDKAAAGAAKVGDSAQRSASGTRDMGNAAASADSSISKLAKDAAAAQAAIDRYSAAANGGSSSVMRLAEGYDVLTGRVNGNFLAIGRNLQSLGLLPNALNKVNGVSGATRAGMQQLSFQLNDVAQGFALGINPMTIFAQQSGQVIQAVQLMSGGASGLAGFLAGPWGLALASAAAVLAPFIVKLFDTSDALKQVKADAQDAIKALNALGDTGTLGKVSQATGELNRLLEERKKLVDYINAQPKDANGNAQFSYKEQQQLIAKNQEILTAQNAIAQGNKAMAEEGRKATESMIEDRAKLAGATTAADRAQAQYNIRIKEAQNTYEKSSKGDADRTKLLQARTVAERDLNKAQDAAKAANSGKAAQTRAENLARQAQATDALVVGLNKLAAAYLAGSSAALKEETDAKATAEAISKRADVASYVAQQERKVVAERTVDGAKLVRNLQDENDYRQILNNQVKQGLITAEHANDLMAKEQAMRPLQAALALAEGDAKKTLADIIARLNNEMVRNNELTKQSQDNEGARKMGVDLAAVKAEIELNGRLGRARIAAMQGLGGEPLEDALARINHEQEIAAIRTKAQADAAEYNRQGLTKSAQATLAVAEANVALSNSQFDYDQQATGIDRANAKIEQMLDLLDSAADRTNQAAQGMADAFGSVGDAIGKLAAQFADYGAIRARIDAEIKKAEDSKDFAKAADLREKAQANQIDSYRMLAGTAKTFFKEGSTGYKTLAAAEKAFAVVQLANTAVNIAAGAAKMFASLGPFAFPAVAAMIAIMAGLGFASRGGSGKAPTSAEQVQAAQGTGTVLGDPTGKSESIARALDIVADNTNNMLEYDNSMLRSLRSIDDNIGALTSQLAKQLGAGGAFDTGNLGLGTNTSGGLLGGFPVVGAVLGALFGKTTTTKSLFDQGLQFNPQMLADAIANGIAGSTYQIVETVKKKSGFLGLGSSTKTSYQTTTGALDSDMQKQVGLILGSLRDSVVGAAKIIGLDVADALNAFQVEIGKISFKDMSSSEIEAALQAAFSKVGDQMAGFAVAGLEAFQQAGEGLFETLIRLAKDYQTIDVTLKSIGKTFGAVGASSIAARESLIALFGTLDDFVEATSFYQQNFLTPAQQISPVQQQVQSTLAGLGLSGVDTIAEFKAVVDGIDLTTEAGQQLYASMMQLAPAFYAVEQYQQQQAQVAADLAKQKAQLEIQLLQAQGKTAEAQARQRQLELAAADASLRPLMQQIYAAQDAATAAAAKAEALTGAKDALSKAYETESAAIQQTADKMRDLGDSLRDFRASLTSDELTANPAALAAKFREVGRMASLGDQTAMGNLPQVAKDYLDSVRANATSEQEYMRALAEVKRYTDSAIGAADQGVSVAEQQLEALKTQVGALIDINDSVLTVEQAILNLTALLNPASPTPVTPVTPVTQEQQDREDEREQRRQDREDERQKRVEDGLARLRIQNDETKRMWNQILAGVLPITVRTDPIEPLEVVTP